MTDIRRALADAALLRATQWHTREVVHLPDPERLSEITLLGSYSYTLLQTRQRWIRKPMEIVDGIRETPPAVGRDYLRLIYHHGPRGTRKQTRTNAACPPVPNVARPRKFAHGLYVDIRSCYWSIMMVAGWNPDYNPGVWLAAGRPPYDYPFPDNKIARNCLPSIGSIETIPRYDPRKLPRDPYDEVKPGNELKNLQLPRLIHDVLNGIGVQCLAAGAIYLNNDGMIAPTPKIAEACEHIIEDWGLTWSIKAEGSGDVKASGTYRVGTSETLTYPMTHQVTPIENIYPMPHLDWLQKEFAFLAANQKEKE